jgi:uncharacterized membrane protein
MSDERFDEIIGRLLQAGVWISAAVVAAGGIWYLASGGTARPQYRHFQTISAALRSPVGVLASLAHPTPEAVIQLGLLLLIATPVARVLFSLAAFAVQRDRVYVIITAVVLVVLLYSLAIS